MKTINLTNTAADIDQAAALIQAGEVVAFPTETVYGLGADATNDQAVQAVFTAKGRPADNPLIMTVGSASQLTPYVEVSHQARQLMNAFWPGSLTIILPVKNNAVSMLVTGGLQTVAVRMPDNEATRSMIRQAGVPIVGPSANLSGKPSPTTAAHVHHDMDGKIAAILDDGPTQVGVESTVIDLTAAVPTILRTGAVTQKMLQVILQKEVVDGTSQKSLAANEVPKAPGMKYRHYAPDKPVIVFDPLDWQDLCQQLEAGDAVMAQETLLADLDQQTWPNWSLGEDVASASENLFSGLRYFDDKEDVKRIFVQSMPEIGLGKAYNNRLGKASGGQHFNS